MLNHFFYYSISLIFILSNIVFSQNDKIDVACPDGMVSYWKFDEFGTVSTFRDSYGGHNGFSSDTTIPLQDAGVVGQARKFNGNSEVTVPENKDFDWGLHTSFSVEAWIKTTAPGTGTKVFVGKRRGGNTQMTWWLGYGDNNKAIFFVRDSSGTFAEADGQKLINDGKWHHIVGVRDDSLKAIKVYVDGVQEGITSTFFTGNFSGTDPVYIGYYSGGFYYSGTLDEVAVYKAKLSAAQITQHYNAGKQGKGYCDEFPPTGINETANIPAKYKLYQNYPNPFNPTTVINYSLPKSSFISLRVYDVLGNLIKVLVNKEQSAGTYNAAFDGANLSSGVYFYILKSGNFYQTKKMILLK
jgi:hypothetical protein